MINLPNTLQPHTNLKEYYIKACEIVWLHFDTQLYSFIVGSTYPQIDLFWYFHLVICCRMYRVVLFLKIFWFCYRICLTNTWSLVLNNPIAEYFIWKWKETITDTSPKLRPVPNARKWLMSRTRPTMKQRKLLKPTSKPPILSDSVWLSTIPFSIMKSGTSRKRHASWQRR